MKEVYITCEENGRAGAERAAARHMPGGDLYRPGNTVKIEHGDIPCWGSAIPGSSTFGRTEKGYRIVVTNNGK